MTREEQRVLLESSACHPGDHTIFSMALGTCLRLGEIVGLNVGDVYFPDGRPKSRIRLRAEIAKGARTGDVFLPEALTRKLGGFWAYKLTRRERLDLASPLFCNQGRRRISRRRVQVVFRAWQVIAGFGRLYPFHALRHTAVTNVYRASRDLFLAQRFARHPSPLTTRISPLRPGDVREPRQDAVLKSSR